MHDRESGPVNDALDREIERMLAVDPPAGFERRVRTRAAERGRATPSRPWWVGALAQGVVAAAIVLLAVSGWRVWDASQHVGEPPRSEAAATELHPSALVPRGASSDPSAALAASAFRSRGEEGRRDLPTLRLPHPPSLRASDPRTATAVVRHWLPPVLVDPDEVAGMRALIADVQAGRFEMVVVSDDPPIAAPSPSASTPARAAAETELDVRPLPDARTNENERTVADAAEPLRAAGADDADIDAERPPTQVASAAPVRPLVIAPLTIEPLVKSVPENPEGAAE